MCSAQLPAFFFMANFAQRLKQLRNERKLTQTRLAELLGISPRVYSRWETGGRDPALRHYRPAGPTLSGVSLDELAGRKDVSSQALIRNPESNQALRQGRSTLGRGSEGAFGRA